MRRRTEPELHALGRRIRDCRTAKGWTQEQLGQATGVHWSYVSQVECGYRNPSLLTIERFAKAMGVPVTHLVGD